jgi:hypothetical protein
LPFYIVLRWVRKGGDIGPSVDFLPALRHPKAMSVIALVFLIISKRSGDLILILVMILGRRVIGEAQFGHISTSTLIYQIANQTQIKSNKSGL